MRVTNNTTQKNNTIQSSKDLELMLILLQERKKEKKNRKTNNNIKMYFELIFIAIQNKYFKYYLARFLSFSNSSYGHFSLKAVFNFSSVYFQLTK